MGVGVKIGGGTSEELSSTRVEKFVRTKMEEMILMYRTNYMNLL